jgi:RNA polymerase sigma-70 factor, ECF subfamily
MTAAFSFALLTMADEPAQIAQGLRRRDPEVLDWLIERYQHRLYRYLLHLTGDRAAADDYFQDTWTRVLEKAHQYDGKTAFSSWLFTIARNLVTDAYRRRLAVPMQPFALNEDGTEAEPPAEAPDAVEQILHAEEREALLGAMGRIAPEYREILGLRFQEEMKLEEIARVTGLPLATVKSRLYRGIEALAGRLEFLR